LTGVATVECDIDDPFAAALYLAGSFGMQVRGWGRIVGSCRALTQILANWLNLDLKLLCDEFGDPGCDTRFTSLVEFGKAWRADGFA
jgi:hypothetical protein